MTLSPDVTTDPESAASLEPGGQSCLPRHVAIIMDGNGRWAKSRGMPRTEGHRRGVDIVRRMVRRCVTLGIGYLTLFSFSSENWRRPVEEVSYLMGLLRLFIRRDLADLHASNVRVRIIGDRFGLPPDIGKLLTEAESLTQANTGLTLVVAFNYGARAEIVQTVQAIARDVAAGLIDPASIDEAMVTRRLYTGAIPDPDLIIRTSGEQRLSNFLLWQAAYAEFVFVPTFWPDFDEAALDQALAQYRSRERRFGGVATGAGR
jgi:undecaprenyl diphosphate synthase